jgi:hypothetical protein
MEAADVAGTRPHERLAGAGTLPGSRLSHPGAEIRFDHGSGRDPNGARVTLLLRRGSGIG